MLEKKGKLPLGDVCGNATVQEVDGGDTMKEENGAFPLRPACTRGILKKGCLELARFSQVIVTTTVIQPTLEIICRRRCSASRSARQGAMMSRKRMRQFRCGRTAALTSLKSNLLTGMHYPRFFGNIKYSTP